MSIATAITNFATELNNVYTAINNKETALVENTNSNNLSTNISNIILGIPYPTRVPTSKVKDGKLLDTDQLWDGHSYVDFEKHPSYMTYKMNTAGTDGSAYLVNNNISFSLSAYHVYLVAIHYRNHSDFPELRPGTYIYSTDDSANSYTKQTSFSAVGTNWAWVGGLFQPTVDCTCLISLFSRDVSLNAAFDIDSIIILDESSTFGTTADYTRYTSMMIENVLTPDFPIVRINPPTGTYATSTYYSSYSANFLNYNKAIIAVEGGTSTSYENIYFVLSSAPDGVTLGTQTSYNYAGTSAGTLYCCILEGVQEDITINLGFDAVNSTSDYVTCNITITTEE